MNDHLQKPFSASLAIQNTQVILRIFLGAIIHTRDKNYSAKSFPNITQIHPMGCGVACIASRCHITYPKALSLFNKPELAWTRGIYCKEMVTALAKAGLKYKYAKFSANKHKAYLEKVGTIVFTKPSSQYPSGHYFTRKKNGWMNPWINFPIITPAKSGTEKKLNEKISYVIFEVEP